MGRGVWPYRLSIAAVSLALISPARAEDTATANEIAALRRELRELAARDQKQIEDLQHQVRALMSQHTTTARVNALAPETAPPTQPFPAPPPAIAVLESPGNLPGRSTQSPYTGTGSNPPGAATVTPASPVSSGGNNVVLSLSGQVNRALLFGDDGLQAKLRQVDIRYGWPGRASQAGHSVSACGRFIRRLPQGLLLSLAGLRRSSNADTRGATATER